jgi:hypothetical protein
MTYREAEAILARWREVERLLAEAPAGSDEATDLQAEAARLRDQLRANTEDVIAHGAIESTAEGA